MNELTDDAVMRGRIREAMASRFGEAFEAWASDVELEKLGGHASLRVYWRVHLPESAELTAPDGPRGHALVAMVLAGDPFATAEGPDSEDDQPSESSGDGQDLDDAGPEDLPFVNVQRLLRDWEIPVPGIEHVDLEARVLLLEDLGDTTFEGVYEATRAEASATGMRTDILEQYRQAIDLLVDVQEAALEATEAPVKDGESVDVSSSGEGSVCWERRFDRETLRWELDHFLEWGIEARRDEPLPEEVAAAFGEEFDRLVDDLLALPQTLVLRDYQSRNLMHKRQPGSDSPWVVIDFQDALVGPYVYDLVALLRDSYIELPPEVLEAGLGAYLAAGRAAGLPWCYDEEAEDYDSATVREAFFRQTVQRKLKDAGRFVFIDREKGNSEFLKYIEPSQGYVAHALDQLDDYDRLERLLSEHTPGWGS
jgi:aminoglycoside/choline kinase family phosphotransferase